MRKVLSWIGISLALCTVALAADPYKLTLKDGTVLTLDARPVISGDTATITRAGVQYTLPTAQIDLAASEKANPHASGETLGTGTQGPKKYTDEDLPRLRETSPLANDGEAPAAVPRNAPPPTERRKTSDAKLSALYDREDDLRKNRADWLQRMDDFQDQYNSLIEEEEEQNYRYSRQEESSVRGEEQARWHKEQAARKARIEKDIAGAKAKVADIDDKLEDVRRQIYRAYDQQK